MTKIVNLPNTLLTTAYTDTYRYLDLGQILNKSSKSKLTLKTNYNEHNHDSLSVKGYNTKVSMHFSCKSHNFLSIRIKKNNMLVKN